MRGGLLGGRASRFIDLLFLFYSDCHFYSKLHHSPAHLLPHPALRWRGGTVSLPIPPPPPRAVASAMRWVWLLHGARRGSGPLQCQRRHPHPQPPPGWQPRAPLGGWLRPAEPLLAGTSRVELEVGSQVCGGAAAVPAQGFRGEERKTAEGAPVGMLGITDVIIFPLRMGLALKTQTGHGEGCSLLRVSWFSFKELKLYQVLRRAGKLLPHHRYK